MSNNKSKGNPFLRGNTWTYIIRIPDKQSGQLKQKWIGGFTTEKAAKKALEKAKAEIKLGIYKEPEKITVSEYITEWFENTHRPLIKPSTARGYEVNIRNHILPYIGGKALDKLTRNDVVKLQDCRLLKKISFSIVNYQFLIVNCVL